MAKEIRGEKKITSLAKEMIDSQRSLKFLSIQDQWKW